MLPVIPKPFQRLSIAVLVLGLAQLACVTLLGRPTPLAPPTPIIVAITATPRVIVVTSEPGVTPPPTSGPTDQEIRDGIQRAVDLFAQAYTENDPALLAQAVDQDNAPFRRIVRSRFDDFQNSYVGGQIEWGYTVDRIERRAAGFVLAHLREEGGWAADWLFRQAGDHWVLSEPSVEQIGAAQTIETDYFIFITYPWAEDVNAAIIDMMDMAREEVRAVLGTVPEQKARVEIMPIYGLKPFNTMGAVALYAASGGPEGEDLIEVYAPNSYAFGHYDPDLGWDGELAMTLTHEYTHMTHNRSFDDAGELAAWMSEGLAEYVSGAPNNVSHACYAAWSGDLIPIVDSESPSFKQDLMHLSTLDQDVGLAYALAHSLVAYVVEEHGGLDGFWNLARAYDESQDFDKVLRQTFDVSYAEFDRAWRAWLKEQC